MRGFDKLPEALAGLFKGVNIGKVRQRQRRTHAHARDRNLHDSHCLITCLWVTGMPVRWLSMSSKRHLFFFCSFPFLSLPRLSSLPRFLLRLPVLPLFCSVRVLLLSRGLAIFVLCLILRLVPLSRSIPLDLHQHQQRSIELTFPAAASQQHCRRAATPHRTASPVIHSGAGSARSARSTRIPSHRIALHRTAVNPRLCSVARAFIT